MRHHPVGVHMILSPRRRPFIKGRPCPLQPIRVPQVERPLSR
jgi:hypothetical protein